MAVLLGVSPDKSLLLKAAPSGKGVNQVRHHVKKAADYGLWGWLFNEIS